MGGKVKFELDTSSPIDIRHMTTPRHEIQTDIVRCLKSIEFGMKIRYQATQLFPSTDTLNFEQYLKDIFAGSMGILFNPFIATGEMKLKMPIFGDIDILVPDTSINFLDDFMDNSLGTNFGEYTNLSSHKSGKTVHVLMQHEPSGFNHQFDFVGVPYDDKVPQSFFRFSHSSSWDDATNGIKGAHHKILLNACGLKKYKFSIKHGLGLRAVVGDNADYDPQWINDIHGGIQLRLFPASPPLAGHINSFRGVVNLIKLLRSSGDVFAIVAKFNHSLDTKSKGLEGNAEAKNFLERKILE